MRKVLWYSDHVRAAGGDPILILPIAAVGEALAFVSREDCGLYQLHAGEGASAGDFDGLLFAGGDDIDPARYRHQPNTDTLLIDETRDAVELPLLAGALAAGVPVFGICRGAQLLNVALGGGLIQDIPSQHPGALPHGKGAFHEIAFRPGSRLARLAGGQSVETNSYHHQGLIEDRDLAPGLIATAWSGDGIVEGLEPEPGRFPGYVLAVQWHPEREGREGNTAYQALTQALFDDFVAASAARSAGPVEALG
ncbi:MAG: gamma-glutamyl-gamma-aminobutyrate hydrolase family protein [Candidatus Sericytochromatia bacterium]|nr:gamma-glutamyl-gamma-aminobutyrate hydrolase family protein [Candidatus Tanganyikabacteria bacterium]